MADEQRMRLLENIINTDRTIIAGLESQLATRDREIDRLRAYVREQPCECVGEYGHDAPQPCDRCAVLGEDHRRSAKAKKGVGDA